MKLNDWIRSHMHSVFDAVAEERVASLERDIGITLPRDYRSLLLEIKGGKTNGDLVFDVPDLGRDFGVNAFFGIDTPHKSCNLGDITLLLANDSLEAKFHNHWLPFARTPEGCFLCINAKDGSNRYGMVVIKTPAAWAFVANSFEEFCRLLGWPG